MRAKGYKKLLSKLNQSGTPLPIASSRLDPGVLKLDEYQSNIINAGIHQGLIPYWVEITLRPTCLLKAARAYIVFQTLEKFGEIIKTLPQVQDIEEERFEDTFGMLLLTQEEETAIRRRLDLISELQSIKIDKLPYGLEGEGNAGSTDLSEATDSIRESTTVKQRIPQDRTRIQTRSIRVDTEKTRQSNEFWSVN